MRSADLTEPYFLGQVGSSLFMRGVTIGVHENNGDTAKARIPLRLQLRFQMGQVQGLDHLALGRHAFVRFDHLAVQQLG